jgi:hypothetical protein
VKESWVSCYIKALLAQLTALPITDGLRDDPTGEAADLVPYWRVGYESVPPSMTPDAIGSIQTYECANSPANACIAQWSLGGYQSNTLNEIDGAPLPPHGAVPELGEGYTE